MGKREKLHAKGFRYAFRTAMCIQKHTDALFNFRAGEDAGKFHCGEPVNEQTRNAAQGHYKHAHGFDGYMSRNGVMLRVSLLTLYPWNLTKDKDNKKIRVTAFRPGFPVDELFRGDYHDMWLVQGRYDVSVGDLEPYEPYEIKAIHAKHFLRLRKNIGYEFPEHVHRESTAHFLLTKRNFERWHFKAEVPGVSRPKGRSSDPRDPTLQGLIARIFSESV